MDNASTLKEKPISWFQNTRPYQRLLGLHCLETKGLILGL